MAAIRCAFARSPRMTGETSSLEGPWSSLAPARTISVQAIARPTQVADHRSPASGRDSNTSQPNTVAAIAIAVAETAPRTLVRLGRWPTIPQHRAARKATAAIAATEPTSRIMTGAKVHPVSHAAKGAAVASRMKSAKATMMR